MQRRRQGDIRIHFRGASPVLSLWGHGSFHQCLLDLTWEVFCTWILALTDSDSAHWVFGNIPFLPQQGRKMEFISSYVSILQGWVCSIRITELMLPCWAKEREMLMRSALNQTCTHFVILVGESLTPNHFAECSFSRSCMSIGLQSLLYAVSH